MGSYGDRFVNCVKCGLQGKCKLDEFLNGAEPLTDCDFAGGPLCNACLKTWLEPEEQAKQPREEPKEQVKRPRVEPKEQAKKPTGTSKQS